MGLTLRIAGQTLLSTDLGGHTDRMGPAITASMEYLQYRLDNFLALPLVVPTPRNLRFRRAIRTLDAIIFEIIAAQRRRHHPTSESKADDLLAMLMAARDEETGEVLTAVEAPGPDPHLHRGGPRDHRHRLSWTHYLLSQHPEAERQVQFEVAEVLGGRTPEAGDLPRLTYTRRVIEESMRLYPPVYVLIRDAKVDDEIGAAGSRPGR